MFVKSNRAFTLIELLVVVLIIGILSAIALPQYTVAVEKARMAEALQNAASLRRAIDIYLLENDYPASGSVELVGNANNNGIAGLLDIDLESALNCTQDGGDYCSSKYFSYDAYCSSTSCSIYIYREEHPEDDEAYDLSWSRPKSTGTWSNGHCSDNGVDSYSEKLCTQFNASH